MRLAYVLPQFRSLRLEGDTHNLQLIRDWLRIELSPNEEADMAQETLEHAQADSSEQTLLTESREQARAKRLRHAGQLTPGNAWRLVQSGDAILVDIRSAEERHFVGHVPGSLHVPWATGTALVRNPRFVKELEARAGRIGKPLLLICRSGKRSTAAAEAATAAGLTDVFNVLEGFEGDLDDAGQRGHFNGWRFYGLPWKQD